MIRPPFNFQRWVEDNRHLLQPPVGARKVFEDANFIIMVVGGPNTRKDYHINQSEEFFWMLEGDMTLKVVDGGVFRDIEIREGDVFLLPGGVPHSPQRRADTVGLVVERQRMPGERDGLRWYCESCATVLHETFFEVEDFLGQMKAAINAFHGSETLRTCGACGAVMAVPVAAQPAR